MCASFFWQTAPLIYRSFIQVNEPSSGLDQLYDHLKSVPQRFRAHATFAHVRAIGFKGIAKAKDESVRIVPLI